MRVPTNEHSPTHREKKGVDMTEDAQITTVHEIIQNWLIEHGYDGLYDGDGCGCTVADLMPCVEYTGHCMPGYYCPCDDDPEIIGIGGKQKETLK